MEIHFTFAGIEFEVGLDVGPNLELYGVAYVAIKNKEKSKFEPISCDKNKFYKDLEDLINSYYEEELTNLKSIEEDILYDAWKDEQAGN